MREKKANKLHVKDKFTIRIVKIQMIRRDIFTFRVFLFYKFNSMYHLAYTMRRQARVPHNVLNHLCDSLRPRQTLWCLDCAHWSLWLAVDDGCEIWHKLSILVYSQARVCVNTQFTSLRPSHRSNKSMPDKRPPRECPLCHLCVSFSPQSVTLSYLPTLRCGYHQHLFLLFLLTVWCLQLSTLMCVSLCGSNLWAV